MADDDLTHLLFPGLSCSLSLSFHTHTHTHAHADCYIGPQGIVHGTTITVLNAGRKYLGMENLKGKVFITAGEFCPRVVRCFLS